MGTPYKPPQGQTFFGTSQQQGLLGRALGGQAAQQGAGSLQPGGIWLHPSDQQAVQMSAAQAALDAHMQQRRQELIAAQEACKTQRMRDLVDAMAVANGGTSATRAPCTRPAAPSKKLNWDNDLRQELQRWTDAWLAPVNNACKS